MIPEINERYVKRTYKRFKRIGGEKLFFNNLVVKGLENLRGNRQRLEIANHISHADYLVRDWVSLSNGLAIPFIPAGINLKSGFLDILGLDFSRLGGFWIDRNLLKNNGHGHFSHSRDLYRAVVSVASSGSSSMIFPEGGRNEGDLMSRFEPAGVRSFIKHAKDPDLVCICFDYDVKVEGWLMDKIAAHREKKDFLYKFYDFSAFALRPLIKQFKDVGNAYMNVSKPVRLADVAGNTNIHNRVEEVRKYSAETIKRLYDEIQEMKRG